jgi:putative phosphoribosyl transferase
MVSDLRDLEVVDVQPGTEPQPAPHEPVRLSVDGVALSGDLARPPACGWVVLFAHGSGSSRHSPRNRSVAGRLQRAGFGTLLLDLLTAAEEELDRRSRELRFDIGLLARRLVGAVDWLADRFGGELRVGLFGASTGAAGALVAAAERPDRVAAVVSRGGRPDLAGRALGRVRAPTLLIVGGADPQVLALNRQAAGQLAAEHRLEVVPGAGHLFEEPGALDEVARLAAAWFSDHLTR